MKHLVGFAFALAAGCHHPIAPPVPPPRPIAVVVAPDPRIAIAAWDRALAAARPCLVPPALADLDPRDALSLALDVDAKADAACGDLAALAAAAPPLLAALAADLPRAAAATATASDAGARARFANQLVDLDDLDAAMHAAAHLPLPPHFGTTRVPLATASAPLSTEAMDTTGARPVVHDHELTYSSHTFTARGVAPAGWRDAEAVGAATWGVRWDGATRTYRTNEHVVLVSMPVKMKRSGHAIRALGEGSHRVVVFEWDREITLFESRDRGKTWRETLHLPGASVASSSGKTIDLVDAKAWVRIAADGTIAPRVALPADAGRGACAADVLWTLDGDTAHWIDRTGKSGTQPFAHERGALDCAGSTLIAPARKGFVYCTPAACGALDGDAADATSDGLASARWLGDLVTIRRTNQPPRPLRLPPRLQPIAFVVWDDVPTVLALDADLHVVAAH